MTSSEMLLNGSPLSQSSSSFSIAVLRDEGKLSRLIDCGF